MLCSRCHKNEANVYYSQVVNGQKQELHICSQCAKELNLSAGTGLFSVDNFINGFLGKGFYNAITPQQTPTQTACSSCGLSLDGFARTGRFGCPSCYEVFKPYLPEMLKKIHGSAAHTGKVPVRLQGKVRIRNRLEELKLELAKAIANEEFERAAVLRDEIRKTTAQADGGTQEGRDVQ